MSAKFAMLQGRCPPEDTYAGAAWWMLVIFVASIPAEAVLIVPQYGSLTRVIGALLLVIVTLDFSARGRVWPGSLAVWCAWGFAAWALLSIAWSLEPQAGVDRAVTYLQLALMFSVVLAYADSSKKVDQLLMAYVLGALVISVSVFINFRAINFAALAMSDVRVSAFGVNPNEQGLTLVAGLPWAAYFARRHASRLMRLVALAAIPCLTLATILTASRAAFVALAVAGVGMVWMMADARRSAKALAGVVVAGVALYAYARIPSVTWERLLTTGSNLQRLDLNQRVTAWQAGYQYFADSPFKGIGTGSFEFASARVINIERSSHNSYLGVLVETGVIGACLFGALVACVARAAVGLQKDLRRAMLATLIPMSLGMFVTGWDYRKVPWLFFALAIALWRLPRQGSRGD